MLLDLTNMSNFACQACLYICSPRQTLLDKQVLLVNVSETFCLSQAKECFLSACLCDSRMDNHCIFVGVGVTG